jgi:hypothetical protein
MALMRVIVILISLETMKTILFSLAFLFLAKLSASAIVDLGSSTSHTPYDSYMSPVKQVFSSLHGGGASMDRVDALMRQGRGFRYAHTDPYNPAPPQQTAARKVGDCKDKALWLCDQLQDPSARFVIGKMKRNAHISHAWVMWQHEGRWWILDCTMNSAPIAADKVGNDDYVPLYSFSKGVEYRHSGITGSVASVASKSKAPVASRGDRRVAAN